LVVGPATQAVAKPPAKTVSFRLETVFIAPTKPDGAPWDGMGAKSPTAFKKAIALLSAANPSVALADFFVGPLCVHLQRPDPYGSMEIAAGPSRGARAQLGTKKDEFSPSWSSGWTNMPLSKDTAIRVVLHDKDVMNPDDIGVFIIRGEDLVRALEAGKVTYIDVHDQARGVLLAGISVLPQ